mgnify:FL=1
MQPFRSKERVNDTRKSNKNKNKNNNNNKNNNTDIFDHAYIISRMEKYALNNNSNNAPNPAAAHKKAAIKGALVNPYSDAETYYSAPTQRSSSPTSRLRSFSVSQNMSNDKTNWIKTYQLQRRGSEDVSSFAEKGKRLFFIEAVNKTLEDLLKREDTDSN